MKKLLILILLISPIANADFPNAFHKNKVSASATTTFVEGCTVSAEKAGMTFARANAYCSCLGDWQYDHVTPQMNQDKATSVVWSEIPACAKWALNY